MLLLLALIVGSGRMWADSYEQLTSIANIDESAQYVLGIDGTGFHYSGTSSWGKTALPSSQTPIYYTLTKASDGESFTAQASISGTTYYLQVPTSNTFSMATSSGTNTDLIIGTTQVSGTNYAVANKTSTTRHLRINGSSGLRSYAGTTGSMAFFYKVVSDLSFNITACSNNTSWGTVSLSGNIITAAPANGYTYADPAYMVSPENSATVSQNGNKFTVIPTANTTVTINFVAIPTHTATFSVNGTTTTQDFAEGATITFPESPSEINGMTFVGWTTTTITGTTNEAPAMVTSTTMGTSDVTFYAVFAYESDGGTPTYEKLSSQNFDKNATYVLAAKQSSTDNTMWYLVSYSSVDVNVDWGTMTNDPTTTAPLVFTLSGTANALVARDNNGNYLDHGAKKFKMSSTETTSKLTDTGSITYTSSSTTYTLRHNYNNGNGGLRWYDSQTGVVANFYKVVANKIYSDYCTTVTNVACPEITVAANPFLFSTTATITCATEGSTIMYSFDNETWSNYTEPLTITEPKTIYAKSVKGLDESSVVSVMITKNLAESTVTINATGITNTNVYEGTDAGTLAATVAYNDNAIADAIVTWSGNNNEVATIDAETGIVTLVAAGTVTFTATYAGNSDYAQATATYEMTVTNTDPNAPGTQNNPYTVAQAIAYIQTLGSSTSPSDVYVHGIISQVDSYNDRYHSITYWISDDGTTSNQMQVYSGMGLNGADFSSKDDLMEGDIVTVKGKVKKYNSTYEFDYNNELVSLERPASTEPSISVANNNINVTAEDGEGTINVTYENISEVAAEIAFFEEDGTTAATYDWITAEINDNNNIEYLIDANAGAARTAYMKVWAYDDDLNEVYSDLITITQAAPVIDYATLPFSFNGKKEDIEGTTGLIQSGLGSNYSAAPYLKFDDTGDYAILKFNERPGKLTFDIKGNGFSGGTFTVQTSEDGETYTNLKAYKEISGTQNETFNNLGENVRYIKWIYTEKVNGNVALGNINLEAAASTATITLNAACTDGEMVYGTYSNTSAFVVSADIVVAEVGIVDGKLFVDEYKTGAVVPANTGVMVSAQDGGKYTVTLTDEQGTSVLGNDNMLRATGAEGITAEAMAEKDSACKYYRLTMHNGEQIGFWYGAENGGAFAVGANKAYLAVPTNQAKDGFAFGNDGDATEIVLNALKGEQNGEMYNLQGQKVGSEYKGIVIVNGKKVMVK